MLLAAALSELEPSAEFNIDGDTYAGIEWLSPQITQPSEEQVAAKIAELEQRAIDTEYQRLRAPEYPPLTDLADAIYWQQQGDDSKMAAYVAACEAVKAKYPKPDDSPGN